MTAPTPPTPEPRRLTDAAAEIERHVSDRGWEQPARLFALAETSQVLQAQPELAEHLGLAADTPPPTGYTPVEQDLGDRSIEDLLPTIAWPDSIVGCALCLERIVLPPGAEEGVPEDPEAAMAWAGEHPDRSDIRLVVAVHRDGEQTAVLRVRGHDGDSDLLRDDNLAPDLAEALAETFR